jgi:flagellar biosynthetic protein FliQ
MTPEFAIEMLKNTVFEAVTLAMPILLAAMVIGLAVSLFQAVTSIHEQTLSFVPKAIGIVGVLVVLLPWMVRTAMQFTTLVIERLPQMVR